MRDKSGQNNDECKREETTSGDNFPLLNSVHCCPENLCCQLWTPIAYNSHWFPCRRHFTSLMTFLLYSLLFSGSSSFLLLYLSTALQGQDFSPLSGYNFSEFTLFSSPLSKSSPNDLSRKNKLPDCTVIREIIHIKHSPCEHERYKSPFKQSRHSAVTGRGIAYLRQNWPF